MAWSSAVHILGVGHDSPANPRAIDAVVEAVQPDAIATEQPEKMRAPLLKAAKSPQLSALLDRLTTTPITSMQQAVRDLLNQEDRVQWERSLTAQGVKLNGEGLIHYVLGHPGCSEGLAAAYLAEKYGASWVMIDTDEQARKRYAAAANGPLANFRPLPGASEAENATFILWAAPLGAVEDATVRQAFQQWWDQVKATTKRPGLLQVSQQFLGLMLQHALKPDEQVALLSIRAEQPEKQQATQLREQGMCRRLQELCSGELTGRPCQRVVAVVGRGHVAPLTNLLKAANS